MAKREFPPSRVPSYTFADTLEEQELQLRSNPLMLRMLAARREKAADPHRPFYHYVNPENTLNDPNGLCRWQGLWHLFYQAQPPDDTRQHWDTPSARSESAGGTFPTHCIRGRRTGAIPAPHSSKRIGSSPCITVSESATWWPFPATPCC